MTRFALIENNTGYVWHICDAANPVEAAKITDAEHGAGDTEYTTVSRFNFSNDEGFHVYEMPAEFDIDDGQDEESIKAVTETGTLAALVAPVSE